MALLSLHTIREGHHYSRRSWRGEDHRGVADHCKVNKRRILNWVNAEDWIALLDVVPTMFTILTGYVIIMFLANAILIGFAMKKIKLK